MEHQNDHLEPYAIAAGRSIISVVLLLPMVVKGKSLHISRNVIGGAVCYTIFNYCFIISTKLATSAIAIMMQYTAPVYVAVLAWIFFKERITKADLISIVFIFGGMFLFFTDEAGGGSTAGKIIAVFNGISFAGISIFLRLERTAILNSVCFRQPSVRYRRYSVYCDSRAFRYQRIFLPAAGRYFVRADLHALRRRQHRPLRSRDGSPSHH